MLFRQQKKTIREFVNLGMDSKSQKIGKNIFWGETIESNLSEVFKREVATIIKHTEPSTFEKHC